MSSIVIDELGFKHGKNRTDIAVINENLIGVLNNSVCLFRKPVYRKGLGEEPWNEIVAVSF